MFDVRRIYRPASVIATSALWATLCSDAAPAQRLPVPGRPPARRATTLDDVVRAMGGRERVLGARTLVVEGRGENYNLGQNRSPDAELPVFEVTEYRRLVDFPNRRSRLEQLRTPRFPTGNPAPQRQRFALDNDVAFNILPDGSVQRAPTQAVAERTNEFLFHPLALLQPALASTAQVTPTTTARGRRLLRINVGYNEVDLLIDPATNLPARARKYIYHPMLGDVVVETEFRDWTSVDGLKLPMRIVQRLDDRWPLSDIQLTSARVNADVGDLTAPGDVRATPPPDLTVTVAVDTVAPGVWYLAGQSHHSVAIEMRDHLLLVEAPQSQARTLAVIRRARELRPGKPLRAVIATHHHFDHAGGIRAAMSEGLPIITHAGNAVFFRDLARRRHYIVVDSLSADPRAAATARVDAVSDKRVLTDGVRTVELHHIRGSPHAETLLMVYLPAERLLIEADAYNPPAANAVNPPPAVFAPNLVANIDRLGLAVDHIVPIHGRIIPMSDVRAAAQAAQRQP